jgi:hypothetical protein
VWQIPKPDILAECQKKGAISDWFPFKNQVDKVKEDEVMLVWCEVTLEHHPAQHPNPNP